MHHHCACWDREFVLNMRQYKHSKLWPSFQSHTWRKGNNSISIFASDVPPSFPFWVESLYLSYNPIQFGHFYLHHMRSLMTVFPCPDWFCLTKCQRFFIAGELFGGTFYLPLHVFPLSSHFQGLLIVAILYDNFLDLM